jgi:transcriptional regulator with XRE-family HTH domain
MTYIYDRFIFFLWLLVPEMKVQKHISPIEQYVIDFVRKLRTEKEITQEDIGNILEVSRSYIGDIESRNANGKYNMTHVNILADHFNISPKDFFPQKAIPPARTPIQKDITPVSKPKSSKALRKKRSA